jgi:hypothetical protein
MFIKRRKIQEGIDEYKQQGKKEGLKRNVKKRRMEDKGNKYEYMKEAKKTSCIYLPILTSMYFKIVSKACNFYKTTFVSTRWFKYDRD